MDRVPDLRQQYLKLTNNVLPRLALQQHFPVKYNHCFQRIVLDNLFGCCWYEVLNRQNGPAYKQLTEDQLKGAIAIAEAMTTQPSEYTQQLNQNSLLWRGKLGSENL